MIVTKFPFGARLEQHWPGEIIFKWGQWKRYIKMPWHRTLVSEQWRMADGSWIERPKLNLYPGQPIDGPIAIHHHPNAWRKEYPFEYFTRQGGSQRAVLTAFHARAKRRPHWLRWLPIGSWDEGISYRFSEEMGNQRGSWKGGVIGSSQSIFPGETVDQCVARVMSESDFCR